MITKNYKNWFLWVASIAVITGLIAYFVPSAPVRPEGKQITHVTPRGGKIPTTTNDVSPAKITAVSQTAAEPSAAFSAPEATSMSYSKLKELLDKNPSAVKGFVFDNGLGTVAVTRASGTVFTVVLPDNDAKVELRKRADELKIDYDVKVTVPVAPPVASAPSSGGGGGMWTMIFIMLGVMVVGSLISSYIQRYMAGKQAGGGVGNFGKSRAKNVKDMGERAPKVTFDDVAGVDEAVAELKRACKGVIDAGIYADFDGKPPTGILLLGPPGTGKTMLAKAVAGECDGSFSALSGSDFVEMFVGVGAARIRDEFALARKTVDETKKPYVIFIDEFDAVGGKRSNGANANQEREATLNQLLVEMDGVENNRGIILIAATNRADMLDEALLRTGRFECHISVDLPDIDGREKIFAVHTRKKKLATGVSLKALAQRTYGYSGADIKGASNRAALNAAERWIAKSKELKEAGKTDAEIAEMLPKEILDIDFDEGIDWVRLGAAKTGRQALMSDEDKNNTKVHEGGHAVAAAVMPGSDPVVKITVMARSRALGYVQYMPDTERVSFSSEAAIARIVCAMAGAAAQRVYLNRVDTGASNDYEQACDMAYKMVTKWGMSRLGRISVGDRGAAIGGHGSTGSLQIGGNLANEIDAEWRRIVAECDKIAQYIIETEKLRIERLTAELGEKETMLRPRWEEFLKENPSAVDLERLKFDPAAPAQNEGGSHE